MITTGGEIRIKVCMDPHCDEVALNCPRAEFHCRNCGGRLISINEKTYARKFANAIWRIDYSAADYPTRIVEVSL